MEPGRKLDWEVRYYVFGIKTDAFDGNGELWTHEMKPAPHYSTDISAAWEVVEKMNGERLKVEIIVAGSMTFCTISDSSYAIANAEAITASEAICKAALLAVMGFQSAQQEKEKLIEVLRQYGDDRNYQQWGTDTPPILEDRGYMARYILKEIGVTE